MAELSLVLRRRIVAAYRSQKTRTDKDTADMFGVGLATVSRLLRRQRETNDVKAKPRGGNNPRAVDLNWLLAHAQENPDARLRDRIEAWQEKSGRTVSIGAMWNSMHAIRMDAQKKRPFARERDGEDVKATRKASLESQAEFDPARLIFLDESGFRGFMTINSGTCADVFRVFVSHRLVPNLRDGDVVVMDNLSAHKKAPAMAAISLADSRA